MKGLYLYSLALILFVGIIYNPVQSISSDEEISLRWLASFYNINWGSDLSLICSNGAQGITCTSGQIVGITIDQNSPSGTSTTTTGLSTTITTASGTSTTTSTGTTGSSTGSKTSTSTTSTSTTTNSTTGTSMPSTSTSTNGTTSTSTTSTTTTGTGASTGITTATTTSPTTTNSTTTSPTTGSISTGPTSTSTTSTTTTGTGASTGGSTGATTATTTSPTTTNSTTTSPTIGTISSGPTSTSTTSTTTTGTGASTGGSTGATTATTTSPTTTNSTTTSPTIGSASTGSSTTYNYTSTTTTGTGASTGSTTVVPVSMAPISFNPSKRQVPPLNLGNTILLNSLVLPTSNRLVFPNLQTLKITHRANTNSSTNIFQVLGSYPSLTTLIINGEISSNVGTFAPANNPSLKTLDLTGCGITSSLSGSYFTASIETLNLKGNTFGGLSFSQFPTSIKSLSFVHGSGSSTILNTANFPNLLTLDAQMSITTTLNVDLTSITSIQLNGTAQVTLNLVASSLTSLKVYNLELSIPNLSVPLLTFAQFDNVKHLDPTLLSTLFNPFTVPSLITYIESNSPSVSNMPTNFASTLVNLDLHGDVYLSGSTDVLCIVDNLNLVNTSVTTSNIGACFSCYSSDKPAITSWFSVPLQNPTSQYCSSQISYTPPPNGYLVKQNDVITISGNNLGWGTGNINSGLTKLTNNKLFTYRVPQKPQWATDNAVTIPLQFGTYSTLNVLVTFKDPFINGASFMQTDQNINITVSGKFYSTPSSITIGGLPCSILTPGAIDGSQTNIVCQVSQSLKEGASVITLVNADGTDSYNMVFVRQYPVISSMDSNIPVIGGTVVFYGSFQQTAVSSMTFANYTTANIVTPSYASQKTINLGALTPVTNRNVTITIGGVSCTNIQINSTTMTCDLPPGTKGPKTLVVDIDGYTFTSTTMFFMGLYDDLVCTGGCGDHGTCVDGKCSCEAGYGGSDCSTQSQPQSSVNTLVNNDKPVSTMSVDSTEMGFGITGIQEIDLSGEVAQNFNLDVKWNSTSQADYVGNSTYSYGTVINGAILTATATTFKNRTVVMFAGESLTYEAGTLKLSINITGWKFMSSVNTLRLLMTSTVPSSDNPCASGSDIDKSYDNYNNLQYLTIVRGSTTFFGRFMDKSLSDGRPVYSTVRVLGEEGNKVNLALQLQHCYECIVDPDLSVLVSIDNGDQSTCGDDKKSRAWVLPVAIVVPCVAVACLVVAGVVLKKKFYLSRNGGKVRFISRRGTSSRDLAMKHM